MLAAAQRLRRREDFAATIRSGRRAGRGAIVVHYLQPIGPQSNTIQSSVLQPLELPPTEVAPVTLGALEIEPVEINPTGAQSTKPTEPVQADQPSARAGFVVSKAVGNAVVRNTVKRRLRHLVRARIADLPAGSVLVVRALPEAAARRYHSLEEDLDLALEAVRRPKNRGARR